MVAWTNFAGNIFENYASSFLCGILRNILPFLTAKAARSSFKEYDSYNQLPMLVIARPQTPVLNHLGGC